MTAAYELVQKMYERVRKGSDLLVEKPLEQLLVYNCGNVFIEDDKKSMQDKLNALPIVLNKKRYGNCNES